MLHVVSCVKLWVCWLFCCANYTGHHLHSPDYYSVLFDCTLAGKVPAAKDLTLIFWGMFKEGLAGLTI
jgi:hypothetical protein